MLILARVRSLRANCNPSLASTSFVDAHPDWGGRGSTSRLHYPGGFEYSQCHYRTRRSCAGDVAPPVPTVTEKVAQLPRR